MIKKVISNFIGAFGYDIVKTENFNFGKHTKRKVMMLNWIILKQLPGITTFQKT